MLDAPIRAREGLQAANQVRRPLSGEHHLAHRFPVRRGERRGIVLEQLPVAQDRDEDVVEIVRDAARQGADRVHALAQLELFLQAAAVRDVTDDGLKTAARQQHGVHLDGDRQSILAREDALADDRFAAVNQVEAERLAGALGRGEESREHRSDQLVARVPGQFAGPVVDLEDALAVAAG